MSQAAEQLVRPLSPAFTSFWFDWTVLKAMVFMWLAVWGFGTPFYETVGLSAADWWEPAATLVMFLCVWAWLLNDGRRFKEVASTYGGLALYILWPLLLPFYLVQTRGWRRASAALVCGVAVWIGSSLVGAVAGALLSTA